MTKQTTPLGKAITTAEGVASLVLAAVIGAASAIDPTKLPHGVAAAVSGGLVVCLTIQRGLIKVSAIKELGVDPLGYIEHVLLDEAQNAPVDPDPTPAPPVAPVVAPTPAPADPPHVGAPGETPPA